MSRSVPVVSSHTNGVSVSYTYDTLNRLSTVVDNLDEQRGGYNSLRWRWQPRG